jgi:hypothetical protein
MTYIYINAAGGGISNRLNTFINGLGLHKLLNKKVIAFWNDNHYSCKCNFEDIYLLSPNDVLEIRHDVKIETKKYILLIEYPDDKEVLENGELYDVVYFRDFLYEELIDYLKNLPSDCDIVVRASNTYGFGPSIHEMVKFFHKLVDFQPEFKKFIHDFIHTHELDVGIHMRMTDKIFVNRYNVEDFEKEVQRIRDTVKANGFFICSDDSEYEAKAMAILPNSFNYKKNTQIEKKIQDAPMVFTKDGEYLNTFENFIRNKDYSIDGFRDLYLLGCCTSILGINTSGSTFYAYAKILSDINLRIVFEFI